MDGRAYERDDFGDGHNFGRADSRSQNPRYGQDPPVEGAAYPDEVWPDTPPAVGQLPRRAAAAPASPTWWADSAPEPWRPADNGRGGPASGGQPGGKPQFGWLSPGGPPTSGQASHEPPAERPARPERPGQANPPRNSPHGQSGSPYGQSDSPYGQSASWYGQIDSPYGQSGPPYGQSGSDHPVAGRAGLGGGQLQRPRHGYGIDGPGTDSDGFAATPFRRRVGTADERVLVARVEPVDELDFESSGGIRFGGRSRRELVPASPRRQVRRSRVSDEDNDGAPRNRRAMPLWQELPLLLVVAFCLAVLIRTFLLQAFFIPSGSMEQTLLVGDRVLVNKIVYDVRPPERGEVVVFRGTDNWAPDHVDQPPSGLLGRIGRTMGDLVGVSRPGEKDFIKRVIALPGDRVSCCDPAGRVYVNGKGIDEPYVLNNSPVDVPPDPRVCRSRRFDEVLVPPGQIFVMGDHRIVSQDARCQGPVPIENVIGRAFVIVWPSGRWDTLNAPETFADVPGPVALGPPGSTSMSANLPIGAAVVTLPILASLVVTTRSGRKPRWGRRTLRK